MKKSFYKYAQSVYNEENNSEYHFTKNMLENNIAIEEFNRSGVEEDGPFTDTWINVLHVNKLADMIVDTKVYTLHNASYLTPIQIHGIIKNVFEMWEENSPQGFIELIEDLSIQQQSSSMQEKLEASDDIMYGIEDRLDYIKSFTEEEETG
ncbi:hypothetical protein ACFX4N_23460 [Priestia sp. YIM B13551]|uniref:hypothetical protein n=1 Tax=Priestia sp. YIM B13551 TaxID=3366306 RepID=UPI00366A9EB0